jgi:hypothetical protein
MIKIRQDKIKDLDYNTLMVIWNHISDLQLSNYESEGHKLGGVKDMTYRSLMGDISSLMEHVKHEKYS